jgi:hypothetical protein
VSRKDRYRVVFPRLFVHPMLAWSTFVRDLTEKNGMKMPQSKSKSVRLKGKNRGAHIRECKPIKPWFIATLLVLKYDLYRPNLDQEVKIGSVLDYPSHKTQYSNIVIRLTDVRMISDQVLVQNVDCRGGAVTDCGAVAAELASASA